MISPERESIQSKNHAQTIQLLLCLIFSHSLEARPNSLNPAFCFEASDRSLNNEPSNFVRSTLRICLRTNRPLVASPIQFVADAVEQIEQASAIVIVTPATKESSPTLLTSLLDLLPDNAFGRKPVLLFATGGLPGHVAILERALNRHSFDSAPRQSPPVSISAPGGWLIVGDDRPRLSRGAEREIAHAIDLVLRVVKPEEQGEISLQLAH